MARAPDPRDLVPMDLFGEEPLKIDIVYADSAHAENIFGAALYERGARLSLHRTMAAVTVLCARLLRERHGWTLVLKDGLRPVEAQARMMETDIVLQNPRWLSEPGRLLSAPGQGAHPRGMAVDVSVEDAKGNPVDMGTVFDCMTAQSARAYEGFAADILESRQALEHGFTDAAERLSVPLVPLASEWWDFRLPKSIYGDFPAFSDADLPAPLRLCAATSDDPHWEAHFAHLAKSILLSL